jgi:hypothetical protein
MRSFFKRSQPVAAVCDSLCRAEQIRDEALYRAALLGPRY